MPFYAYMQPSYCLFMSACTNVTEVYCIQIVSVINYIYNHAEAENYCIIFFPTNKRVLEENHVPGCDETIQFSSYLLTSKTGGDVIGQEQMGREEHSSGFRFASISNILKTIALLQLFNICERNTGTTKGIPKHKDQSKASY